MLQKFNAYAICTQYAYFRMYEYNIITKEINRSAFSSTEKLLIFESCNLNDFEAASKQYFTHVLSRTK